MCVRARGGRGAGTRVCGRGILPACEPAGPKPLRAPVGGRHRPGLSGNNNRPPPKTNQPACTAHTAKVYSTAQAYTATVYSTAQAHTATVYSAAQHTQRRSTAQRIQRRSCQAPTQLHHEAQPPPAPSPAGSQSPGQSPDAAARPGRFLAPPPATPCFFLVLFCILVRWQLGKFALYPRSPKP